MSNVKDYLGLPKGYGAPEFVSENCSKISIDGMDEFRRETHNYGESKIVKAYELTVGDKIYYDYSVLTIKNINDNRIRCSRDFYR